ATQPTTAAQKVRAAKILAGLDRPDLGRQMLAEVLAAKLDPQELFELDQQFGAPFFVSLSARPELAPEAGQVAAAVIQATQAVLQDSARLEGLVRQLASADPAARTAAAEGLMQGGRASIAVLIAALADPARAAEHEMARAVLGQFGDAAVAPLLASMHGGEAGLKTQAIRTLAGIGARRAVPFFLAPALAPGTDAELQTIAQRGLVTFGRTVPEIPLASRMLVEEAENYLGGRIPLHQDLEGNVTVWTWDPAAGRPVSSLRPARAAAMLYAAWLTEDAWQLNPKDPEIRTLYLTCLLEQAALTAGLDKPLPIAEDSPAGKAAAQGLEVVEEVLGYAIDHDHVCAAITAVRILAERGSALGQLSADRSASHLTDAVQHDDPRLRFAALEAIVGFEPPAPFAGSGSVVDAVCHFATSQGQRRVLIGGPSTSESQRIAGLLVPLGFVSDTARSGRELVTLALRSADYEFVLIDEGIQQPAIEFLLQQLRHDNRTALLPVGIWARDGRLPRAEHAARLDPLVTAFPRPHSEDVVKSQVEQVLALGSQPPLTAAQRFEQAGQAMQWLADWSAGHPVFRLPRKIDAVYDALFVPELAPQATTILANTGTPEAQKSLIELASRWTQPLTRRKAAVDALWNNAEGYGILLTSREILQQYDRYNASGALDPSSQQVLSAILNCLEAPSKVNQEAARPTQTPETSSAPASTPPGP
ncbi:MAG: hypothetical protein ACYC6Y_22025, partial [Thermoguttaceae bacterium]